MFWLFAVDGMCTRRRRRGNFSGPVARSCRPCHRVSGKSVSMHRAGDTNFVFSLSCISVGCALPSPQPPLLPPAPSPPPSKKKKTSSKTKTKHAFHPRNRVGRERKRDEKNFKRKNKKNYVRTYIYTHTQPMRRNLNLVVACPATPGQKVKTKTAMPGSKGDKRQRLPNVSYQWWLPPPVWPIACARAPRKRKKKKKHIEIFLVLPHFQLKRKFELPNFLFC